MFDDEAVDESVVHSLTSNYSKRCIYERIRFVAPCAEGGASFRASRLIQATIICHVMPFLISGRPGPFETLAINGK